MTIPLDLDAIERGSLSSTARRLIAELRQTRTERDEAREKVHFYEVQYQDEIGINGLIEERNAALATVAAQKAEIERLRAERPNAFHATCPSCGVDVDIIPSDAPAALAPSQSEIERLKVQLKEMDQHSDAVYAALKERNRLEDELVISSRERIDRLVAKIRRPSVLDCEKGELWFNINAIDATDLILDEFAAVRRDARITESPSQSDRERAKQLIKELCGGESVSDDDSDIEPTARAFAAIRREESERIDRPERQALDEAVRALSKISGGYIEAGTNRDATQEYAAQIVVAIRKLVPNAGGENA